MAPVRVYQMPWMMVTPETATAEPGENQSETQAITPGETPAIPPGEATNPPAQPTLPTVKVHTGKEEQNYNLRTGPATTYPIVRQVGGGATLEADGITEDRQWLEVLDPDGPGGKAFIFVDLTDYDPASGLLPLLHDLAPNPQ
jgi:hypothetical protein